MRAKNILVLHFGQLGDVVLGLPALAAIREHFADSYITVVCGKSASQVIEMAGIADDVVAVDRIELRDGPKLRSIAKIFSLVRQVRRLDNDIVIDLHSLSETNLLAFASGAGLRLLADRKGRSLNLLCNFRPRPPKEDRQIHLTSRYYDVLTPLAIRSDKKVFRFPFVLRDEDSNAVGLFPGAGHPSRCWPYDKFGELSRRIIADGFECRVFLGPEEESNKDVILSNFPPEAKPVSGLDLRGFTAAVARLRAFVSNDTGPMHLAACTGCPVILVLDERAPMTYLPLAERLAVVNNAVIDEISVDDVYDSLKRILDQRPQPNDNLPHR